MWAFLGEKSFYFGKRLPRWRKDHGSKGGQVARGGKGSRSPGPHTLRRLQHNLNKKATTTGMVMVCERAGSALASDPHFTDDEGEAPGKGWGLVQEHN